MKPLRPPPHPGPILYCHYKSKLHTLFTDEISEVICNFLFYKYKEDFKCSNLGNKSLIVKLPLIKVTILHGS